MFIFWGIKYLIDLFCLRMEFNPFNWAIFFNLSCELAPSLSEQNQTRLEEKEPSNKTSCELLLLSSKSGLNYRNLLTKIKIKCEKWQGKLMRPMATCTFLTYQSQ